MAPGNKNKSKKNNVDVCFNDCKLQILGNKEMVQCHICQTWAHYTCIDEHKDDIIGIWCCNGCRSLPKTVAMLSDKMAELQQNMQALLLIIRLWLKQRILIVVLLLDVTRKHQQHMCTIL